MAESQLKIVSDGTSQGTYIEDEDGNRIKGVQSIEWNAHIDDNECWATIEIAKIPVELSGVRRYE